MSASEPASNSLVATPSLTVSVTLKALSMSSGSTQTRPSSPENDVPGGGQAVTVSVVSAPPLLSNLPMAGSTVTHSGASSKPA